jgi:hypothetical protein
MSYEKKTSKNFENAKIYALISTCTDLIYVGSTCLSLPIRLRNHKELYKQHLKGNPIKLSAFKLLELGDVDIKVLQDCKDVCCKKELLKRERYWIENNLCVNKNIPSRTMQESQKAYYQNNKERCKLNYINNKDKKKQYYLDNCDKRKAYQRDYIKRKQHIEPRTTDIGA